MVDVDGDTAVIGRSPDADVTVSNPLVSAQHLRIDAGVVIHDLRSRNGTWSRGVRLEGPTLLRNGEVLLGPDPRKSPSIRVEVLDAVSAELPESDEHTLVSLAEGGYSAPGGSPGPAPSPAPDGIRNGVTDRVHGPAKPGRNGLRLAGTPRIGPAATPQAGDRTAVHPVARKEGGANGFTGIGSEGSRDFVIDACLQSLRALEMRVQPLDDSEKGRAMPPARESELVRVVEAVLAEGADAATRQRLLDAFAEQRRLILGGYNAYRRASVQLIEELRDRSLTESSLVGYSGIPLWRRLLGQRWRILWARLREQLVSYDKSRIESRLDDLARQQIAMTDSDSGDPR